MAWTDEEFEAEFRRRAGLAAEARQKREFTRAAARLAVIEEEKRKREEKERIDAERGSPGYVSPKNVANDSRYTVVDNSDGHTYPSTMQIVVKHIEKGTFWMCKYGIRDDDSDYGYSQNWFQVEPRTETVTVYDRVKE